MTRLQGQDIRLGDAVQLSGADRAHREIAKSLESLREDALRQAEAERDTRIAAAQQAAIALLKEARQQAEALVQQARSESDAIRQQAEDAGREAGYADGYATAQAQRYAEMADLLAGAHQAVDQAALAQKRLLHRLQDRVALVLSAIAESVLGQALDQSAALWLPLIETAIASLDASTQAKLVLSQSLYETLQQAATEQGETLAGRFPRLSWVPDAQLDAHTVYLLHVDGTLELSPKAQVATLVAALKPAIAQSVTHEDRQPELDALDAPMVEAVEMPESPDLQAPCPPECNEAPLPDVETDATD